MLPKLAYEELIKEKWVGVEPNRMAQSLMVEFRSQAASECLLRAYLAEQWDVPDGADFWLDVFQRIRFGDEQRSRDGDETHVIPDSECRRRDA